MAKQKQRQSAGRGDAAPPGPTLCHALHAALHKAGFHHSAAAVLDDGKQRAAKLDKALASFVAKHAHTGAENGAEDNGATEQEPAERSERTDDAAASDEFDGAVPTDESSDEDDEPLEEHTRRRSGVVQKLEKKLDCVSPDRPSPGAAATNGAAALNGDAAGKSAGDENGEAKEQSKEKKKKKKKKDKKKKDGAEKDVEMKEAEAKDEAEAEGASKAGEAAASDEKKQKSAGSEDKDSKKKKKKKKKKDKKKSSEAEAEAQADGAAKSEGAAENSAKDEPVEEADEPVKESERAETAEPSAEVVLDSSKTPQSAGSERKRKRTDSAGKQGSQDRFKRVKEDVLYTKGNNPQRRYFQVHNDKIDTPTRGVKKQKMKARVSYSGGSVSYQVNSFKYDDSDSD